MLTIRNTAASEDLNHPTSFALHVRKPLGEAKSRLLNESPRAQSIMLLLYPTSNLARVSKMPHQVTKAGIATTDATSCKYPTLRAAPSTCHNVNHPISLRSIDLPCYRQPVPTIRQFPMEYSAQADHHADGQPDAGSVMKAHLERNYWFALEVCLSMKSICASASSQSCATSPPTKPRFSARK